MRKRKIAYISGTRADFGLMTPVLKTIEASDNLELQLYATGVHLMTEFGKTIKHVRKQFPQTQIINATFSSNDRAGVAVFTGFYLQQLVKVLNQNRPDFILVLGDRVEMLCTALAATYLGIPSAQLHGGEKTSTVDEVARHAITKLVSLHFPATEESARRIERLGEKKWRIHVVGAPALDFILNAKLPARQEIFGKLGLNTKERVILVIQHPVSEEIAASGRQMEETLSAVKPFNLPVVVIFPNADLGARSMTQVIERERRKNPLIFVFESLEYHDFLALEREVAVLVGNSSSGMIESSSFKIPVVNIGNRQNGRQHGENVIHVGYSSKEIIAAIKQSLYDGEYLKRLKTIKNPWGDGKTASRVVKILEDVELGPTLLSKQITY